MLWPLLFFSCTNSNGRLFTDISYRHFKDSVQLQSGTKPQWQSTNVIDDGGFDPAVDTPGSLFISLRDSWKNELNRFQRNITSGNVDAAPTDTDSIVLLQNLLTVESFLVHARDSVVLHCKENQCPVFVQVVKSVQKLYLYLDGALTDSFLVSTGVKGYLTPDMNTRASGPMFIKYTSRKFPGGNYEGLGNMPYAVFVKGGYAIHGTTPGNFRKLGTPASHGCIRLHPDNARLLYELVKMAGIENTWISVSDSLRAQLQ